MNRETYLLEVEKRLNNMFCAAKDGYKAPAIERHRLEGFMQAGVFMGLVNNAELGKLMKDTHKSAYGMSIEEPRTKNQTTYQDDLIEYSQYDQPAYERLFK